MEYSKNIADFWSVVFDEEDYTCFGMDAKKTPVYPHSTPLSTGFQYFSINALHPTQDLDPVEVYHDAGIPRRADANVVKHRTFLVEIDCFPHDFVGQRDYVESANMPWSTCMYSGNKSLHYLICLDELLTKEKYAEYAERIHRLLTKIDHSTKNPSRFTRTPGSTNKKTGNAQKVIAVKSRITLLELEMWLQSNAIFPPPPPDQRVERKKKITKTVEETFEFAVKRVTDVKGKRWVDGEKHAFLASLAGMCKAFDIDEQDFRRLGTDYIIDSNAEKTVQKIYK